LGASNRSAQKVLNVILNEQTLDDDHLDTVFCEVEAIVNGRPLTVIADSANDFEALTPNHLLLLRSGSSGPLSEERCLHETMETCSVSRRYVLATLS